MLKTIFEHVFLFQGRVLNGLWNSYYLEYIYINICVTVCMRICMFLEYFACL